MNKKMYIGYVNKKECKFRVSESPIWFNSDLGWYTNMYYFISPDVSVRYLGNKHFDMVLQLKTGQVMYSLDKEKVQKWVNAEYKDTIIEVEDRLEMLRDNEVIDLCSDLAITSKKCPKCYGPLHESDVEGYDYVCLECDENFFECELR